MIIFGGSISKFFSIKNSFQIKRCAIERIFRRPGSFDYQKQFTNSICGKHVLETFNFAFVSKIKFHFQNAIFTRDIAKVS